MPENSQQQYLSQNDEISLKEIVLKMRHWFFYFVSKWKIIVLAGLIGGAIAFIYVNRQKPIYTGTLTFALEDESGGGLSGALGLASSFGFDLSTSAGGAFRGGNLIELMRSRRLVEQTLLDPVWVDRKQISLAEMYIQINELRKNWVGKSEMKELQFMPDADRSKFTLQQDSILGIISHSLITNNLIVAQKDRKVSIINIDVKSENEMFAKLFVETLAKEVSDFYIETRSKKAKMNLAILESQADSIRAELNNAITGVAIANDNTYNLNPALNVRRTPSSRRQVDVQANSAILTELVKNLEMAKVTLRKETPLIQVIDRPILPLTKEQKSKLRYMVMGGIIAGVLAIILIIAVKWWKELINPPKSYI